MKIIQHFNKIITKGLIIYRLNEAERGDFLEKLPNKFRACYISKSRLENRSKKISIKACDFLDKYILPDDPSIKSGDFGELLCYYLVNENFKTKGITLFAPKKWKWKESKNKPTPCTDCIMFYIDPSHKDSHKDMLITVESKMKISKSKSHRIQDAINDANKDKLSRMVKTLNWLEEKYAKLGKDAERNMIVRFKDPATSGNYIKRHKAIAVLDGMIEDEEINKQIENLHGVTIIVVSLKELKQAYEQTRINILNMFNGSK